MEFTSGFLLSLSLCLDIGVANIAMITLAMQRGYFQGFALGLGTCFGDLIYAVLALAGMSVLLQYETVRWVLWVGGSLLLLYFAAKMIHAAIHHEAALAQTAQVPAGSHRREFFRGMFLAMSSPSAILWFAAVGGTLIARSGGGSLASATADAKTREAALITFLAAAANITLLGIGGAFWGLLIGLAAHALLNGFKNTDARALGSKAAVTR